MTNKKMTLWKLIQKRRNMGLETVASLSDDPLIGLSAGAA